MVLKETKLYDTIMKVKKLSFLLPDLKSSFGKTSMQFHRIFYDKQ
jgi:hypothetical protein